MSDKQSLKTPPTPNWGGNSTHFGFSINATMTNPADAASHPVWNFSYYYDWSLKAERYDHHLGQHDLVCKLVGIINEPCTVLTPSDGNLYLSSASKGCC